MWAKPASNRHYPSFLSLAALRGGLGEGERPWRFTMELTRSSTSWHKLLF